jgi:hypothetical protein
MCPTETLVALKREAIFDQFPSLIRDEIRGSYRTKRPFVESMQLAESGTKRLFKSS